MGWKIGDASLTSEWTIFQEVEYDFLKMVTHALDEKMKYLLIILNVLAAIWMLGVSPAAHKAVLMHAYSQIRQMEDAGVINTKALPAFLQRNASSDDDPDPRVSLVRLLHRSRLARDLFITPAALAFLLNAVLIGIFWKRKQNKERPTST